MFRISGITDNAAFQTLSGKDKDLSNGEAPGTRDRSRTDEESELNQVLHPLLKALRILGSWPREGNAFILRLTPWNGLVMFILHFYTAHVFFNWMTIVKYTKSVFDVFEKLTSIVRTAVVAITFDLRFMHHQDLVQVFREIEEYPIFNNDQRLINLKKQVKVVVYGCLTFISLHVILASSLTLYKSTDNYVNWLVYGDGVHPVVVRLVMIIDWALYLFLVISNECFTMAMYIVICLILRQRIRDFNEFLQRLEERRLITSSHQVQELYRLHSRLSTFVEGVEENLSFPAFLWVLTIIFSVCVKIEAIVSGIKGGEFEDFGYIFTDVAYYTLAFVIITLVASEVGEENSGPVVSVTKIAEEGDVNDWNFQQETQLLLTKLNTPMMRLTGWSCFELNKSFMLTILGAMATYTIIILQMA